jgi:hypothetical protein
MEKRSPQFHRRPKDPEDDNRLDATAVSTLACDNKEVNEKTQQCTSYEILPTEQQQQQQPQQWHQLEGYKCDEEYKYEHYDDYHRDSNLLSDYNNKDKTQPHWPPLQLSLRPQPTTELTEPPKPTEQIAATAPTKPTKLTLLTQTLPTMSLQLTSTLPTMTQLKTTPPKATQPKATLLETTLPETTQLTLKMTLPTMKISNRKRMWDTERTEREGGGKAATVTRFRVW